MEDGYKSARDLRGWNSLRDSEKLDISIRILKKPFAHRTEDDIALLVKTTEKIHFFQEIGPKSHRECCSYLTLESADANETIIKEGEQGDKFYIILSGTVGVYRYTQRIEEKKARLSPPLKVKAEPKSTIITSSLTKLDDTASPSTEINKDIEPSPRRPKLKDKVAKVAHTLIFINLATHKKEEKVLTEQSILETGDAFGERALLSHAPRKATIIAKTHSYFACLDKKSFNLILKDREEKVHTENINFLHSLNYFKTFSYHLIEQIYYLAKRQKFVKNQVVFSEKEIPDNVYFIREGEFKVIKTIEIRENNLLSPTLDPRNKNSLKKKTAKKTGEVAIFTAGEIFGDYEAIKDIPRIASVICDSRSAELYVLPKYTFIAKLYTDPIFKTFIDEQWNLRSQLHKERIEVIEGLANRSKNLLSYNDVRQKKSNIAGPSSNISKSFNSDKSDIVNYSIDHQSPPKSSEALKGGAPVFFKESTTNPTQRFQEAFTLVSRNHSPSQQRRPSHSERINPNMLRVPSAIGSPKKLFPDIADTKHRKRSIFGQLQVPDTRDHNSERRGSVLSSTLSPVPLRRDKKIHSLVPTHPEQNNFLIPSLNEFLDRRTRTQTNAMDTSETLSNIEPQTVAGTLRTIQSPMTEKHQEKTFLFPDSKSKLRISTRRSTHKDILESRGVGGETITSINVIPPQTGSLQKKRESIFSKDTEHDGVDLGLEAATRRRLKTLTCSQQEFFGFDSLSVKSNGITFGSCSTIKLAPLSPPSKFLSPQPSSSPKARARMTINPLKKANYQKEVQRTKDFMNFKLTGKMS